MACKIFIEIKCMLGTWSWFYNLLKIAMIESFFELDGKIYEHCDSVMSIPLRSALADVFMCHFGNIWLENCVTHFKPIVRRLFIDETFLLCQSKGQVQEFTSEIKGNSLLSFLIKISRKNSKFVTTDYRWYCCFHKILDKMLIHRSFRLCPNHPNFHGEIETLKSIFKQ